MAKNSKQDAQHFSQRITIRQIQKLTGNSTDNVRTLPVLNPSEQNIKPCKPGNQLESATSIIETATIKAESIHWKLACIIHLTYLHGLRISEVLSIKGNDIMKNGTIKIKALKKSNQRVITTGKYHSQLLRYVSKPVYIFSEFNRYWCYHQFKKLGISFKFGNNSVHSVTHAGRHIVALLQKENNIATVTTQSYLGHKSEKSTEVYRKP